MKLSSRSKILAIDPGITTGIAAMFGDGGVSFTMSYKRDDLLHHLRELIPHTDLVAIESWRLFASHSARRVGSDFPEVKLIGVIEYLCELANVPFVFVQPAEHKRFFSKLNQRNLKVGSRHEVDAVRIGLFAMIFKVVPRSDDELKVLLDRYKGDNG